MPRKTKLSTASSTRPVKASMRPRPDAAENGIGESPAAVAGGASMRPRPDAAENTLAKLLEQQDAARLQ